MSRQRIPCANSAQTERGVWSESSSCLLTGISIRNWIINFPFLRRSCPVNHLYNHLSHVNKTLFKLSFPDCTEMGWHVFSFDSAESVDLQWVMLYMYDPCSLYMNNMNNMGWGGWWSDKRLSRKYVFILTPKHIATSVLWFKFLSFYVGIKYAFYALIFTRLRGRCWKYTLLILTSHFVMDAE